MKLTSIFVISILVASLVFISYSGSAYAEYKTTAEKEEIDVNLIFVTSFDECSKNNWEALEGYNTLTRDYLWKYNIRAHTTIQCINVDSTRFAVDNSLSSNDLTIIFPDILKSLEWLYNKNQGGHYTVNGNDRTIVSEAVTFKPESEQSVWTLSHELSHFALEWYGYPYNVWSSEVHQSQADYYKCLGYDSTGAYCRNLWELVESVVTGKKYPVMEPLRSERNVLSSVNSQVPPNSVVTSQLQSSNIPQLEKLGAKNFRILNENSLRTSEKISFGIDFKNSQNIVQPYAFLVQIQGDTIETQLKWVEGKLSPGYSSSPSTSWIPTKPGVYSATAFGWVSVNDYTALMSPQSLKFQVYKQPTASVSQSSSSVQQETWDERVDRNIKEDLAKSDLPNKIQLSYKSINTLGNSLGMKYENPDAQKKVFEALQILERANNKLNDVKSTVDDVKNTIANGGDHPSAFDRFKDAERAYEDVIDDLQLVSNAIGYANELEKTKVENTLVVQESKQDIFAELFNSGNSDGKVCFIFWCW